MTTRYVGPYLYEWPSVVHNDQAYPPHSNSVLDAWNVSGHNGLKVNSKDPVSADTLAKEWRTQLATRTGNMKILTNVDGVKSARTIGKWLHRHRSGTWPKRGGPIKFSGFEWTGARLSSTRHKESVTPKFVILAAGMGTKRTRWVRDKRNIHGHSEYIGDPFWKDDDLRRTYCGQASRARIVVLGGGDGALQDTMRCLFSESTPLETFNLLLASSSYVKSTLKRVYPRVLAIEQQHAASQSWASEGSTAQELASLEEVYLRVIRPIAKDPNVYKPLLKMLRRDVEVVHLVVRDSSLGKAYSLNRFLILLVNECQKVHTESGAVNLDIAMNAELTRIDRTVPNLDIEITVVVRKNSIGIAKQPNGTHDASRPRPVSQ